MQVEKHVNGIVVRINSTRAQAFHQDPCESQAAVGHMAPLKSGFLVVPPPIRT